MFSWVARLYRADFDVALRIPVFKVQARSERIYKAPMLRFYLSINFEDVVPVRQTMRCNTAFHETPHHSPRDTNSRQTFPMLDCSG